MPYTIDTFIDDEARRVARKPNPFGPGLPQDDADRVSRIEVVGSSCNDPGDDWCRFDVTFADGGLRSVVVDGF